MSPRPAPFDEVYSLRSNPKFTVKLGWALRLKAAADFADYIFVQHRAPVTASLRRGAVFCLLRFVFAFCHPFEVISAVVETITVRVSRLVKRRRARTVECPADFGVDVNVSISSEIGGPIIAALARLTARQYAALQGSFFSVLGSDRPWQRPDAAEAAHFISRIAVDRTPFFCHAVVYYRRFNPVARAV